MAARKEKPALVEKRTTAMRTWPGPLVFAVLVAAASAYTLLEMGGLARAAGVEPAAQPAFLGLAWHWFAGAATLTLVPLVQVFWRSRMSRYRLYADRLVEVHGLLGRQSTELPVSDIREVLVRRTLGQRMMGLGDVVVLGDRGPSVQFRSVARPNELAGIIEGLREGRLPAPKKAAAALPADEEAQERAPAAAAGRAGERPAERPASAERDGGQPEPQRPEAETRPRPKAKKAASDGDARDELWRLLEQQAAEEEGKG
ncbi:MAG: PH domain-containing protein [Deltaproteobacteria bacterium]|nr:MAG: PH domain-containing protein [Deltaproteobacteria bacterium]